MKYLIIILLLISPVCFAEKKSVKCDKLDFVIEFAKSACKVNDTKLAHYGFKNGQFDTLVIVCTNKITMNYLNFWSVNEVKCLDIRGKFRVKK